FSHSIGSLVSCPRKSTVPERICKLFRGQDAMRCDRGTPISRSLKSDLFIFYPHHSYRKREPTHMKMSSPLNSVLTAPPIGIVGSNSSCAATRKVPATVRTGMKRHQLLALTILVILPVVAKWKMTAQAAGTDNCELAMVIKETTNPYYNATLSGARIAAGEIGGSANNYGPTQSSGQAQVEIINNLADRHVPAIAVAPSDPDAVVPAMKRAQKLGTKVVTFDADSAPEGRPFFVNQATSDSIGRFGAQLLVKAMGTKGKVAIVSAQPTAANQNAWIAAFRD